MSRKRGKSKKIYIAIAILAVLCVVTGALVYVATLPAAPAQAVPGVKVGDTFTYKVKGASTIYDENVVSANDILKYDLGQYNQTQSYTVTITGVNGTSVSMDVVWRFINGTEIPYKQTIDLSNGMKSDDKGFYAVYPTNLNVNDRVRPNGADGVYINTTDTRTYSGTTRAINSFSLENEFFNAEDPTHSTYMNDYRSISFDKQTGMLVTLVDYQQYNNPQMIVVITYTLASTNIWTV